MGRLIQIGMVVAVAYVAYRLIRNSFGGGFRASRSEFPCATCKNCRTLFDDGVICTFGRRETFKNETHIANCRDYERGRPG